MNPDLLAEQGLTIEREWTRDNGDHALLLKPATAPKTDAEVQAVLDVVSDIAAKSEITPAEGFPQWLKLRKVVFVAWEA